MSKPGYRTIVALAVAALLVFTFAFVGIVTMFVRNAEHKDPAITAYAHGKTVTVAPFMYCTVRMRDCRSGETAQLEVPPGYPLQLSLPPKIADAPWIAQLIYIMPNGDKIDRVVNHSNYPDGALAVSVESQPEPDLRLIGVELQLPIPARDETGREFYIPHAAWSISTGSW